MDIAKIRKKAKEKEAFKKKEGQELSETLCPEPAIKEKGSEEISRQPATDLTPEAQLKDNSIEKESDNHSPVHEIPAEEKEASMSDYEVEDTDKDLYDEFLTFKLLKEEFAFRVSDVEEIIRHQSITRVPSVPGYVLGITSLRGKIIPVIDLKARLNLKHNISKDYWQNPAAKILIVSGPKGLIGTAIDKVIGVIRFPSNKILEPPAHLTETEMKYIEGIITFQKHFISVIKAIDTLDIELA